MLTQVAAAISDAGMNLASATCDRVVFGAADLAALRTALDAAS